MNYKLRHRPIVGQIVDLVPLADEHTLDVVRLRNSPHVRTFFDEKDETTVETQTNFLRSYLQKSDDLYWAVRTKDGAVIGTNRLSDIDENKALKGSQIIDADYARQGPYALESELLMLDFAFNDLKLSVVYARIHPDNTKVISFNEKLNAEFIGTCDQRGVLHNEYILRHEAFSAQRFASLIDYFAKRRRA